MGFFSKLFKGPEIDMEKSNANAEKMRLLFNQAVENGADYQLIFAYTEDVSRFNYGFVHGSKTKVGNLIVGWNEANQTIVALPTVPALSGCGTSTPPMPLLSTLTEKATSVSMPATGWKTRVSMYMCHRPKRSPLSQIFL